MKFTVQYIPLHQIKADSPIPLTAHIKNIRKRMWDCMHMLAVRKNRKGSYIVISGHDRYEYLTKHTNRKHAPCLVDTHKETSASKLPFLPGAASRLLQLIPGDAVRELEPASWNIVRMFIRQEPRFSRLPRTKQIKLLFMALRYKKTVVAAMKAQVDKMLSS